MLLGWSFANAKTREVAGAVATQGSLKALPHRVPLGASPDAMAGNPDAEDDLGSLEELVVDRRAVAAVRRCVGQRASSEGALGVLVLVSCE